MIDESKYTKPGLYLLLPDGEEVVLTRERIEERAQALLDDVEALPPATRAAAEFQPCEVCPERKTAELCHAIMTTLPFLDEVDRYMSFDRVTAILRDEDTGVLMIRETSMQEALQYVSMLSLTRYCEVGQKYGQYFAGVNPLMPQTQIAEWVFRNMYFACHGNLEELMQTVETMQRELLDTAKCQIKRLRLITRSDAFLNAFVATQCTPELILLELRARAEAIDTGQES